MKNFTISVRSKFIVLLSLIALFFILSGLLQLNSLFRLRDINSLHTGIIELQHDFSQTDAAINELFLLQDFSSELEAKDQILKQLSGKSDRMLADLRPALNNSERNKLRSGLRELSGSLHEYSRLFDELTRRIRKNPGSSNDIQQLLELSISFEQFTPSVKNEYFSFLLHDMADLGRKYSITPGADILKKIGGRVDEAGKILAENAGTALFTGNETTRSQLFSKLSDLRILVNGMLETGNRLVSSEEGTRASLNQIGKSVTQNLNLLNDGIADIYHSFFINTLMVQVILLLLLAAAIMIFVWRFSGSQVQSLARLGELLHDLVSGKLPDSVELGREEEYVNMTTSLKQFIDDLQHKANFAAQIGRGNFQTSYHPLSEDDILGNSLIEMQSSLHKARIEQEKHQVEEEKRRWINEGLARFAEVLRSGNNKLNELADQIIQNLVRYLHANQGGLFLLSNEAGSDPMLELTATFAYNRKKYLRKQIALGEGVLGTCALEKETILLTEIPADYIEVTSGLGEATPNCLVLVPLKLETELLGVIEIASFETIQPHEIDFLEKIAASIASTISSVRINTRTSNLLVQSQQQAQELAEKEEEMRQSMEELQATQEESARREMEITGILNAINHSSIVIEFDPDGKIIDTNDKLLDLLGTSRESIVGKRYSDIVMLDTGSETYHKLWAELREGIYQSRIENIRTSNNRDLWLSVNFTPILDRTQKPYKIMCIASDISESKIQEMNLKRQSDVIARKNIELESLTEAVDESLIKCIYDTTACIIDANENYEKTTGFSKSELLGKENKSFLKHDEEEQFRKIWVEVMKGKVYTGVLKRTRPTGEELWLMSNFTPVKDEKGNIYKVYFLAQDITEKKLKYKLLEEANREIERLRKQIKD